MADAKVNRLNLTEKDYDGAPSTMCRGCGHDAISASVQRAYFENSIDPRKVVKLSGIGCSSKTPAYFLSQSFGFNAVHGRMSAVATGANLANHTLLPIGVSGDGDTSAIGLGNFCHMMRRNINITYIIENNGVYGLTKGQFSATADVGSVMKGGKVNDIPAIDLAELAITLGATYVARSFSGDRKQLYAVGSRRARAQGQRHLGRHQPVRDVQQPRRFHQELEVRQRPLDPIHDLDFIPPYENIEADYEEGTDHQVEMHDGSRIILHKLGKDYDPTNKAQAIQAIHGSIAEGKFLTGLIYYNPNRKEFAEELNLCDIPLSELTQDDLQPPLEALERINADMMK